DVREHVYPTAALARDPHRLVPHLALGDAAAQRDRGPAGARYLRGDGTRVGDVETDDRRPLARGEHGGRPTHAGRGPADDRAGAGEPGHAVREARTAGE